MLQVLDKRSSPSFSLRDMELLAVFARQAAIAIEASKVQRDTTRLLRSALAAIGDGELTDDQVDTLVAAAADGLDADDEAPFWGLVELLTRLRDMGERETAHGDRDPGRGRAPERPTTPATGSSPDS